MGINVVMLMKLLMIPNRDPVHELGQAILQAGAIHFGTFKGLSMVPKRTPKRRKKSDKS